MNEAPRKTFPLAQAKEVGTEIIARLQPFCEMAMLVGSVRRQKPQVGDLEILYISRYEKRPDGLFDSGDIDLALEAIDGLVATSVLEKRKNVNGSFIYGQDNRLCVHVASGIPVDLFRTTQTKRWNSLVIRTGGKETNLRLTTGAQKLGRKLHAYGEGVTMENGELRQTHSEQEVFELCHVPYLPPERRR